MATIQDLGKKVKAKFPGQYDDLGDQELGQKIKAKFPKDYGDFTDVSEANQALAGTGLSVPNVPNPPRPYALASPKEQAARYLNPMSAPKGDIIPYQGMGSAGTSDILEGAGRMANDDKLGGALQTTGGVLSSLAGIGMPAGARPNRGFESTTARLKAGLTNAGTTPVEVAEMALSPKTAILKKVLGMVTGAPKKGAPISPSIPAYVNKSPMPPSSPTSVSPMESGISGPASDISQGPYTPPSGMPQMPTKGGMPASGEPMPQMRTDVNGGASQVTTPDIPPYLPPPPQPMPTATRGAPMPFNRPMTRTGIPESANPPAVSNPAAPPVSTPDTASYRSPVVNTVSNPMPTPSSAPPPSSVPGVPSTTASTPVLNTVDKAGAAEALKNEMGGTPGQPLVFQGSDTTAAGEAAHEANSWLKELRGHSKVPSNADLAGAIKNKAPGDVSSVRDSIIKAMSPEASSIVLKELGIEEIPQMAKGGVVLPAKTVLNTVRSWEIGNTPPDHLSRFILKQPNVKLPNGESFNTFKRRVLGSLKSSLQDIKGKAGHKDVDAEPWVTKLVQAWAVRGYPDSMEIDSKMMASKDMPQAATLRLRWRGSKPVIDRVSKGIK